MLLKDTEHKWQNILMNEFIQFISYHPHTFQILLNSLFSSLSTPHILLPFPCFSHSEVCILYCAWASLLQATRQRERPACQRPSICEKQRTYRFISKLWSVKTEKQKEWLQTLWLDIQQDIHTVNPSSAGFNWFCDAVTNTPVQINLFK